MNLRQEDVEAVLNQRFPGIATEDIESIAIAIMGKIDLEVDPYSEEQETRFRALKEASGVLTPTYGLAAALSPSPERARARSLVETVDWVLHGPKDDSLKVSGSWPTE